MQRWSKEEIDILQDSWGNKSIKCIATNLHRSINSVRLKANRIGLEDIRKSYEGITILELSKALGISYCIIKNHWIREHKFPAEGKITAISKQCLFVKINDFWIWAYKNMNLINFSRFEKGTLGKEPEWVNEKRKADIQNIEKSLKQPWTKNEDGKLINLVKLQRYTYPELAEILGRSEAAIKRRLNDIKIKDRPLQLEIKKWVSQDYEEMVAMKSKGYGWNTIGEKLGRSALGCRGKFEREQKEG